MEANEKLAYSYWAILAIIKGAERLQDKGIFDDSQLRNVIIKCKDELGLAEFIEQLTDKQYLDGLMLRYGSDIDNTPVPELSATAKARKVANVDPTYKSFTEIVVTSNIDISPSYALQSWLRSRNTTEFLTIWEREYNRNFRLEDAKELIAEADAKNSAITLKKWIERTGAIGIVALQGRYGGTYAHPVIALDFQAWLSPRFRLTLFRSLFKVNMEK